MEDDLTPLSRGDHWLGWLGDDPAQIVRDAIEDTLQAQVPSAKLPWLRLQGEPEYLTGGRRSDTDPNKIIVTRAALAVAFTLEVQSDSQVEHLSGVFSWVAVGLDTDRRDRTFFDLGADLAWAAIELKQRIYALDDG